MVANLRLVLAEEVQAGNAHTSKHSAPELWELVDRLAAEHKPSLLRGDANFGNEPVMREAEQRGQPYLLQAAADGGGEADDRAGDA